MTLFKKVFITGCAGVLGTEIQEQLIKYGVNFTGSDKEVDIRDYERIKKTIDKSKCDVVIHCAAMIDVPRCEIDKQIAYEVNYIGATNVAQACKELNIQMVQISSDYVYDGSKEYKGDGKEGNYSVNDYVNPINYYAFTKTLADIAVQHVSSKFLICRLSFKKKGVWPYPKAFIDQYTSRDTVDVIAKQLLNATFSGLCGVVHLGTERKTVWELAVRSRPDVEKISITDIKSVRLPKDTSLKLTHIPKIW